MGFPDAPSYAEKRAAKEFYNALPFLLPCPECQGHFRDVLAAYPVNNWLDNRASLMEWTWTVHNEVNARLKHPLVTKDEFLKHYHDMAEQGLPVPPSGPRSVEAEAYATQQYTRGISHTLVALGGIAVIGGLLWASYPKRGGA